MAELLVAALFGLIVMATLYGFFREQMFNLLSQETKTATLEDARGALDIMVRELRNAGSFPVTTDASCLKDGSNNPKRVVAASSTSVQIQSDTQSASGGDPDGKCTATGESVTYTYVSTANPATDPCPGKRITRNENCLVANVVIPSGSNDILTYYPSGTNPAPYCFSAGNPAGCSGDLAANLANIKRIKITFAVQVAEPTPEGKAAGRNITSTISSNAEFRN